MTHTLGKDDSPSLSSTYRLEDGMGSILACGGCLEPGSIQNMEEKDELTGKRT